MGTTIGTWTEWRLALGAVIALLVGLLTPPELRAEQNGESSAAEKRVLDVIGETPADEPKLSVEEIIAAVHAAGFSEISKIEREKGVYEVKVRRPRKTGAIVFEVYVDPKTGELVRDPETDEPLTKRIGRRSEPTQAIAFEEIVAKVEAAGYLEVYSIEYEHSLYEVKARDAEGRRVELYVHPKTGKLLKNRSGDPLTQDLE